MSADRLLSLMLLLQTRGRMSARRLAEELGVSVRTVHRDLGRLHAAGIPVYAEHGRAGGYQLLDGYRTRLTGLSASEARVLFLAGLPAPAADLGLAAEVAATRLKLLAALPAVLREEATRADAVFHLDAPGWYREAEEAPYLPLFVDAVFGRREVDVRYRRWREPQEVDRRLRPYGLVLKSGTWYLVAGVEGRTATFRISQVLDATVRDERFERPEGFALGDYWSSYLAEFEARRHTGTATVRFSPRGRERPARGGAGLRGHRDPGGRRRLDGGRDPDGEHRARLRRTATARRRRRGHGPTGTPPRRLRRRPRTGEDVRRSLTPRAGGGQGVRPGPPSYSRAGPDVRPRPPSYAPAGRGVPPPPPRARAAAVRPPFPRARGSGSPAVRPGGAGTACPSSGWRRPRPRPCRSAPCTGPPCDRSGRGRRPGRRR